MILAVGLGEGLLLTEVLVWGRRLLLEGEGSGDVDGDWEDGD